MDLKCSLTFSISRATDSHSRNVLWALGGALASTVIIFASLGSIQNQCRSEDPDLLTDVNGFSGAVLGCKKLYRYYWFITSFNLVTGVYGAWITSRGFLAGSRAAILGLLTVALLLTINMTDAFLSIVDIPKWQEGPARDRVRTMIAGCIITAVFQAASIVLVGMEPSACSSCCMKEAPAARSAPATSEIPPNEATVVELAPIAQPVTEAAAEPAPAAAEPAPAVDVEAPIAAVVEAAPVAPEPAPAAAEPAPSESAAVAVAVQ